MIMESRPLERSGHRTIWGNLSTYQLSQNWKKYFEKKKEKKLEKKKYQ